MRTRLLFSAMLTCAGFVCQGGGQPIDIPIDNSSFEQPPSVPLDVERCGLSGWQGIPGWNFGASTGIFQPTITANTPANPCYIDLPPDGSTVAFAGYGGTFTIDLGVKPSDIQAVSRDGIYTLTFYVGNYFTVYPSSYEAKLSIGEQELCSTKGWAKWFFTPVTLVCPSPGYLVYDKVFYSGAPTPADPNATLVLSFTGFIWKALFDNMSLTFTPTQTPQ
jgi:hypothetical protein